MAPVPTYICCQCREGPQNVQSECVCSHRVCDDCTYVKGAGGSSSLQEKTTDQSLDSSESPRAEHTDLHILHRSRIFELVESHLKSIMLLQRSESEPFSDICTTIFSLPDDLLDCVMFQVSDFEDIAKLLILCGMGDEAYATTFYDYVNWVWGRGGWQFIQHLIIAWKHSEHYWEVNSLSEPGLKYKAHCKVVDGHRCKIMISGSERQVTNFAALLSLVTACFHKEEVERGIAAASYLKYSRGFICRSTSSQDTNDVELPSINFTEMPVANLYRCEIRGGRFSVSPSTELGACWHPLFQNCMIAVWFPVPERGKEMGVEVQFDIMVTLARVSYFLELPLGRVLKGHSTMLIPTPGTTNDTIQWHFIQSDSPDLYLPPDCIPHDHEILDLDVGDLRKCRSFVGYCNRAHIIAGTKGSCYESVQQSQAGRDHRFVQIGREISTTMGTGGMGIFGGGLATKITLTKGLFATVQAEESRVEDRLLNSNDSPALLFDVGKRTGFIVPELNVCLQILHVWASRQADREEILSKIPFIPKTTAGSEMALQAVMSNKQLLLREGYAEEKPLYFMSKLKEIFLSLEKRKEQRRIFNESSVRMGVPSLRGWELVDIAACRPSWEKGIRLPFSRFKDFQDANPCYKIIRDNPDMIVLFSEGMADAIKPFQEQVCGAWDPLPRDPYLILASLKCLKTLSRRNGGSKNQLKLTKKLFMSRPTAIDTFEACLKGQGAECSHVYSMSKTPDESLCLDEDGAVILGQPKFSQKIIGGDGPQVTSYCLDES